MAARYIAAAITALLLVAVSGCAATASTATLITSPRMTNTAAETMVMSVMDDRGRPTMAAWHSSSPASSRRGPSGVMTAPSLLLPSACSCLPRVLSASPSRASSRSSRQSASPGAAVRAVVTVSDVGGGVIDGHRTMRLTPLAWFATSKHDQHRCGVTEGDS